MDTEIRGHYFFPRHSQPHTAVLRVHAQGIDIELSDGTLLAYGTGSFSRPTQVGKTPICLMFDTGASFQTVGSQTQHQSLQRLLDMYFRKPATATFYTLLHTSERRLGYILCCLGLVLGVIFWGYFFGINIAANYLASMVPKDLVVKMDEQVRDILLDNLGDSRLSAEQKNHVQHLVTDHVDAMGGEISSSFNSSFTLSLYFADDDILGANALALPAGSIIFTDTLVNTLNDKELLAVFAHEAGHVAHQHGLKSVIHSAAISLLWFAWIGDGSSFADTLLLVGPTTLQQLSYSREAEKEADTFAINALSQLNIPQSCLATALTKIVGGLDSDMGMHTNSDVPEYLSTHPNTASRIAGLGNDC